MQWGEYVSITAYAEWERCCCVNYTMNLLTIANLQSAVNGV